MLESFLRSDTLSGYQIWYQQGKSLEKIRLCVDFINLNRASDKDNYPVPPMEQLLQMVSGSELFSLLDDFSDYNQVLVPKKIE